MERAGAYGIFCDPCKTQRNYGKSSDISITLFAAIAIHSLSSCPYHKKGMKKLVWVKKRPVCPGIFFNRMETLLGGGNSSTQYIGYCCDAFGVT